jgi:hypothetical protein
VGDAGDSVGGEPPFEMLDVVRAERIVQTADVRMIRVACAGACMPFEFPPMDRHVAVAQPESAVDERDEHLARGLLGMPSKPFGKPAVECQRKTHRAGRPG